MSFKNLALTTIKRFAALPALHNRPAIHWQRRPALVSGISFESFQGPGPTVGGVDLTEGCLITRTVKYTHQLIHWVNKGESPESTKEIENLVENLGIIQHKKKFSVDDPCNLTFLNPELHVALEEYGFIAVTASAPTLDNLITMVRSDNDRRQREVDEGGPLGAVPRRVLDFSNSSFLNPEYELVALHPLHLFPDGSDLSVYDRTTQTSKRYVAASDQCLRESVDPSSSRFPAFRHVAEHRNKTTQLNVFLVILNADLNFRQYFELESPETPLPDDVLDLMGSTMELVDLLYWKPQPQ